MKLLSDIINELIETNTSLTSPLLKTKVLATRIKNDELLGWVNSELAGYPQDEEMLPTYRKAEGMLTGTYINYNHQFTNQAISVLGLPDGIQKAFTTFYFVQSVAALETLNKGDEEKGGFIQGYVSAEHIQILQQHYRKKGNPYVQLLQVNKFLSPNIVTEILAVIRSKLLDFMLKLEDQFQHVTEIADLKNENKLITELLKGTIMNNTIINTGDANVVNTGDNAVLKTNITITKGDKNELREFLKTHHLSEDDITDLITVIDTEQPNYEKQTFGNKVNQWITKMMSKALDGSWQIAIGAAGNLLADGIAAYYGLKGH